MPRKQKKLVLPIILAIVFGIIRVTVCLPLAHASSHKVRFVYDGDTILLYGKGKVRYLGINAPEINYDGRKDEFMAREARVFNVESVRGTRVRLEYDYEKRDRHGRLLAYIFLENGDMVNELLVRKGLAHVMFSNKDLKYRERLLDCQRKAIQEKLGIWSRPFKGEERLYLGNPSSFRFHKRNCPFGSKISRKNVVKFKSRHDAFWAGYSPCTRCAP